MPSVLNKSTKLIKSGFLQREIQESRVMINQSTETPKT